MVLLAILFLVTAVLYSSVGFGGGSTYLALFLIWEIPYFIFPILALFCNIIVVSGNCFNYIKAGNLNTKILFPYLIGSVPMSYFGGTLLLEKEIFEILLFFVLTVSGFFLLYNCNSYQEKEYYYKKTSIPLAILIGGVIGLISGAVGIGGGIFLSPILFLIRAGKPKHIITAASLFILVNSLFGIIGQLSKNEVSLEIFNYWYLLVAVLIGGQIGNFLNIKILPVKILVFITSMLVIFVSIRIGIKILL